MCVSIYADLPIFASLFMNMKPLIYLYHLLSIRISTKYLFYGSNQLFIQINELSHL